MSRGEAIFLDLCADPDPAAHIRSLDDTALRDAHAALAAHNIETGFVGELWVMVVAEGAKRFFQSASRHRQSAMERGVQ